MTKYESILGVYDTQKGIEKLRHHFQDSLSEALDLTRVSAPLFVFAETGLNDNLNGTEEAVSFSVLGKRAEVVHSLAKWKRYALKKYDFFVHKGIYTDMNAIRKDEIPDNIHSYYVDQWDWERVITEEERTNETLESVVRKIYASLLDTEEFICGKYSDIPRVLPKDIFFITSQELEDAYPGLSPKQREDEICKKHGAVFLKQIGKKLKSGERHDGRSPDYDDWELNGDLLVWYDVLNMALELSSMGIRIDRDSLLKQSKESDTEDRLTLPYHQMILNSELPFTIGGGIGQSRLCMFLLKKAHIGEVQVSLWPDEMRASCLENGIKLL